MIYNTIEYKRLVLAVTLFAAGGTDHLINFMAQGTRVVDWILTDEDTTALSKLDAPAQVKNNWAPFSLLYGYAAQEVAAHLQLPVWLLELAFLDAAYYERERQIRFFAEAGRPT